MTTPKLSDFQNKENVYIKTEIVDGQEFTICSYIYNDNSFFNDPVNVECRGITFDKHGNIVIRPFEKFFNLNGSQWTLFDDLDFNNAIYSIKYDGSLINPLIINDKLYFKTKKTFMGDVAQECNKYFGNDEQYYKITKELMLKGYTASYEFTSPMNRVVIDYGNEPKLTLLAIRDNITGKYLPMSVVGFWADFHNIPCAEYYENSDIMDIMNRDIDNEEGYVAILQSGQRVKIKFPSYVAKHGTLDRFHAKNIAGLVVDELIDDFKVLMIDNPVRLNIINNIEQVVLNEIEIYSAVINNLVQEWQGKTLREIGMNYNSHPQFNPAILIFKGLGEPDTIIKEYYKRVRLEQFSSKNLW